jgi:hypothetical protein
VVIFLHVFLNALIHRHDYMCIILYNAVMPMCMNPRGVGGGTSKDKIPGLETRYTVGSDPEGGEGAHQWSEL